jgi:hypothetical protein
VLLGHELAYLALGGSHLAAGRHGYLSTAAVVAGPLAAVGLLGLAVASARRNRLGLVPWERLAPLQLVLFGAQELIELAPVAGLDHAVSQPTLWLGLALQPLIAVAVARLVGVAGRLVARLLRRDPVPTPGATRPPATGSPMAVRSPRWTPLSRRGPPSVALAH